METLEQPYSNAALHARAGSIITHGKKTDSGRMVARNPDRRRPRAALPLTAKYLSPDSGWTALQVL